MIPFLFLSGLCFAQVSAPQNLDLDSALSRAKAENPQIAAAQARVDERKGEITSARSQALPKLDWLNNYNRVRDVSILVGPFGGIAASMGIDPKNMVHPLTTYSSQLSLTQTLYDFGKVGESIAIAKLGREEAANGSLTMEREILHLVAALYLNVLATHADLEVAEARVKVAEKLLENIQSRLEVQDARKLDLQRARTEMLLAKTERIQADAAHRRAQEMLNGQIGLKASTPLRLNALPAPSQAEELVKQEANRAELKQLQIQQDILTRYSKIVRSELLPKLDFSAGYGYLTDKSHELYHTPYDTWRVGVSLRIPLFDGLNTSGKLAQNRARIQQVRQARVEFERKVDVEVSTARREMDKSLSFKKAAEEGHEASLEALRSSQEAFELGLISSLDLLQATREERQAEATRKKAAIGVWQAVFGLQRALGRVPSLHF